MNIQSKEACKAFFLSAALASVIIPATANAATLSNDNNGDGYVITTSSGFDLFGSNNNSGANTTSYTTFATADSILTFSYTYTTNDCCGSFYDPAGYMIGSTFTQLSPPASSAPYSFSDTISFSVAAGETYGFYVSTTDGRLGRADIAVSPGLGVSAVPLPASAPMFGAAVLALGAVGYGVKRKKAAAAA